MRAWLNLRYSDNSRAKSFEAGLSSLGYSVHHSLPVRPERGDIFVTWNRINVGNSWASKFEENGWPVLVAENAIWGNYFEGESWVQLSLNRHNTAGMVKYGGPERWDSLAHPMAPWRTSGETVILAQRGIGSAPTKMPIEWPRMALAKYGGRIRHHPGRSVAGIPLEIDLENAGRVITWGSGSAVKALTMGIPVISEMPDWVGEQDNTDAGRLEMFRRLAWTQWRVEEISNGEAFRWMLHV